MAEGKRGDRRGRGCLRLRASKRLFEAGGLFRMMQRSVLPQEQMGAMFE